MGRSFLFKLITELLRAPTSSQRNCKTLITSLKLLSHRDQSAPEISFFFFKKKAWQCHIRVWVESGITEALKNGTNFLGIKLAKPFLFFLISLCELTCHSEGGSRSSHIFTGNWRGVRVKVISFTLTTNSQFRLVLHSNMQWAPAVCHPGFWKPGDERETLFMPQDCPSSGQDTEKGPPFYLYKIEGPPSLKDLTA